MLVMSGMRGRMRGAAGDATRGGCGRFVISGTGPAEQSYSIVWTTNNRVAGDQLGHGGTGSLAGDF